MYERAPAVSVEMTFPENHFIYANAYEVRIDGAPAAALSAPVPTRIKDPFSGEMKDVFSKPFTAWYAVPEGATGSVEVVLRYQGCSDTLCFFPQEVTRTVSAEKREASPSVLFRAPGRPAGGDMEQYLPGLVVRETGGGYRGPEAFVDFLRASTNDAASAEFNWHGVFRSPAETLSRLGPVLTVLLILAGGVLLNFTPCVLPMIPVNLAIIGAGAQAGSKARGFMMGGLYGLGMAIAYGALGLIVVFTGAQFGSLNASPWFNLSMAVVFLALALAMFGVFNIDLTNWQNTIFSSGRIRGGGALPFAMGVIAALLAGACVAPVLLFVLILSRDLYAQGVGAALALPFVLGLGMALPWPFAGAGLSFLPKPGRWMNAVKYVFGIIILLTAAYYGWTARRAWSQGPAETERVEVAADGWIRVSADTAAERLPEVARRAVREGRPVFIDFWATWCKNCKAMDRATFSDPAVRAQLDTFITVKYQAEDLRAEPTRGLLEAFGAFGLPAYGVLVPDGEEAE